MSGPYDGGAMFAAIAGMWVVAAFWCARLRDWPGVATSLGIATVAGVFAWWGAG